MVSPSDLAGVEQVGFVVGSGFGNERDAISRRLRYHVCPTSAMLMTGPRVAEAMARDGFLPEVFGRLNSRNVPSRSVALLAVIASIIAVTSSFGPLLIYIGFTLNVFSALTVVGLFRLRRQGRARHKICIGYPVTPIIFLAFTVWMTVWSIQSQPAATIAGILTLAEHGAHLVSRRWRLPPVIERRPKVDKSASNAGIANSQWSVRNLGSSIRRTSPINKPRLNCDWLAMPAFSESDPIRLNTRPQPFRDLPA
jgi:amino acid transporter